MIVHKRHIVLYIGIAAIISIGVLFSIWQLHTLMSYIAPKHPQPTPGTLSAVQEATTTPPVTSAQIFQVEIATSTAAQERGLGGRAAIPHDYGMLFVFSHPDTYGFWMKDMLTSIDMIWLSDTGKVVAVDANVSPSTYPQVFYPPSPVQYVLETRAGEAALKGWKKGSVITLPLPYGK